MYFLAGHRNYSFILTKASAVDKCNKAGDVYGKMLVLTFEDNEDAMMNRILSLINTKEVLMQQQLRIIQYQKQRIQDLVLCWLTYFDPEIIRNEFNIPSNLEPIAIIAVGYADTEKASPDRHSKDRKSLESLVCYETF